MARRSRGRFIRPAAKTKQWIGAGLANMATVASSDQLLSSLNAAALALRPFTIIRTRLELWYESDQAAVTERPQGSFGMIVATDEAIAIGVTALPAPIGAENGDWFVYQGVATTMVFLSSVGITTPSNSHYTIDSKAMRKVGANQDIAIMFSQRNATGAFLRAEGRILVQLH